MSHKSHLLGGRSALFLWLALFLIAVAFAVCASAGSSQAQAQVEARCELLPTKTRVLLAGGANCGAKQSRERINPDYETLWQGAQADLDLNWFYEQYGNLRYPPTETSKRVMGQLREKLGLRSEDVCAWAPPAWWRREDKSTWDAAEVRGWEAYLRNLSAAVTEKVPLLVKEPTRESAGKRAAAAKFLGTKAPHPAFVPLLRALATNPSEQPIVRSRALDAIAYIPHDDVVPFYIEQLYQPDRSGREPAYVQENLLNVARGQLRRLTEAHMDAATRKRLLASPPQEAQALWRSWWRAHKDSWKYPRRGTLLIRME